MAMVMSALMSSICIGPTSGSTTRSRPHGPTSAKAPPGKNSTTSSTQSVYAILTSLPGVDVHQLSPPSLVLTVTTRPWSSPKVTSTGCLETCTDFAQEPKSGVETTAAGCAKKSRASNDGFSLLLWSTSEKAGQFPITAASIESLLKRKMAGTTFLSHLISVATTSHLSARSRSADLSRLRWCAASKRSFTSWASLLGTLNRSSMPLCILHCSIAPKCAQELPSSIS
mmetsp:Transcript_19381/g.45064  ORF Transcript_19381/g.45064 Transcript_19381/m.45064 type:complete len:227 (-) Transcript_19381:360-1040(-)